MSDLNPSSRSAALGCIVYVHHCTIVLHLDGDTYFSPPPPLHHLIFPATCVFI